MESDYLVMIALLKEVETRAIGLLEAGEITHGTVCAILNTTQAVIHDLARHNRTRLTEIKKNVRDSQ